MRTVEPITAEVVLDHYESIARAFFDRDLSRSFDKRTYDEGNPRDGHVSILHGAQHRHRRRVENTQFRSDQLRLYEHELFPPIVDRFVSEAARSGEADLFPLGESLAVVLAARRAGFDVDRDNPREIRDLVGYIDAFSQISAILDARDPDAVRAMAKRVLEDFKEQFGMPSLVRRRRAVEAFERGDIGEEELPHDILTSYLRHRADPDLNLTDDFRIIRGAAIYLQGGTHTSAQTLINTFDLLFEVGGAHPDYWERVRADEAFAQRCVHEALRLRPTTPKAKRRAEAATTVGAVDIPKGAMVVLDLYKGNRDECVFGPTAAVFDPDRHVPEGVHRWGLSFGAGPHICPGRIVAGGLPQVEVDGERGPEHLYGLVATMVRAVAQRGPRPHPDKPQARDDRTDRFTRWERYWVVFDRPTAAAGAGR